MEEYDVILYPKAIQQIQAIYSYIALEKTDPDMATQQTDRIQSAILSLKTFPQRHQNRIIGTYANKGYKQLLVDHYVAIYRIDEEKKKVYVEAVHYQGKNF